MKARAYIEREIDHWDGVTYSIESSRTHPKVRLTFGTNKRFVVFSESPVGWCGVKNSVATLRRTLKDIGAVKKS